MHLEYLTIITMYVQTLAGKWVTFNPWLLRSHETTSQWLGMPFRLRLRTIFTQCPDEEGEKEEMKSV